MHQNISFIVFASVVLANSWTLARPIKGSLPDMGSLQVGKEQIWKSDAKVEHLGRRSLMATMAQDDLPTDVIDNELVGKDGDQELQEDVPQLDDDPIGYSDDEIYKETDSDMSLGSSEDESSDETELGGEDASVGSLEDESSDEIELGDEDASTGSSEDETGMDDDAGSSEKEDGELNMMMFDDAFDAEIPGSVGIPAEAPGEGPVGGPGDDLVSGDVMGVSSEITEDSALSSDETSVGTTEDSTEDVDLMEDSEVAADAGLSENDSMDVSSDEDEDSTELSVEDDSDEQASDDDEDSKPEETNDDGSSAGQAPTGAGRGQPEREFFESEENPSRSVPIDFENAPDDIPPPPPFNYDEVDFSKLTKQQRKEHTDAKNNGRDILETAEEYVARTKPKSPGGTFLVSQRLKNGDRYAKVGNLQEDWALESCANACQADSKCSGSTFHLKSRACWLISGSFTSGGDRFNVMYRK